MVLRELSGACQQHVSLLLARLAKRPRSTKGLAHAVQPRISDDDYLCMYVCMYKHSVAGRQLSLAANSTLCNNALIVSSKRTGCVG